MTQTDAIAIANAQQTKPRKIRKGRYLYRGFAIQCKSPGDWYCYRDPDTCPTEDEMIDHEQQIITSPIGHNTLQDAVSMINHGYRFTASLKESQQ